MSLNKNCKNLKFLEVTLEHENINVDWVMQALGINSLKCLKVVSSYIHVNELRIRGLHTTIQVIINDINL